MNEVLLYIAVSLIIFFFLAFIVILFSWRSIVKIMFKKVMMIVLTDSYQENIIELLPGVRHMGLQNFLENSLRAETGDIVHRPLGSSKTWPHLDSLTFIPAQTTPFAISSDEEIDVKVTIGPKANRPLQLDIPLIISGMAYGLGVNEGVRIEFATAANNVGTEINSVVGGILQEEHELAGMYMYAYAKISRVR